MLGQVGPTQFDLYFPFFGIPVRVTPWFWLLGLFTGYPLLRDQQLDLLLIWVGCLFASVLVHELGHAVAGLCFGWRSQVFLYHLGGVAVFPHRPGETTGRSIVVSFAGPWAGLLLFGLIWLVDHFAFANGYPNFHVAYAMVSLMTINLFLNLLNLAPVYPLDGGQILHSALTHYRGRQGAAWAYKVGMATSAAVAAYFLMNHMQFGGILFAFLAVENFQRLEMHNRGYW